MSLPHGILKMLPMPREITFTIEDMPDGTFRVFAIDPKKYMETEEAEVENVHFTSVADALRFMHINYPKAKEMIDVS